VTLVAGLITLAVAVMALSGRTPHLPLLDLRWALAGGAVLLGLAVADRRGPHVPPPMSPGWAAA
jgi:hypothetical protein